MSWFDKLEINIRRGDIFQSKTESIMITVTTSLNPYGKLSTSFLNEYKTRLSPQFDSILSERTNQRLNLGEAISINIGRKAALGDIKMVVLTALWQDENPYTPNLIYSVYINSIRQALNKDLLSLSLPIIKVPKILLGEKIVQVLKDLNNLRVSETFSVEEIEFVSNNEGDIEFLRDVFKENLPALT